MARTTEAAVSELLLDNYGTDNDLSPFVEIATALTTRVNTCATAKGVTLTSTELELIERNLAAHFYCLSDPLYLSEKTLDASATYRGETGKALDYTPFGQTAKMLDHSGCLATLSKGQRATLSWLGLPPSEQTDYRDRD